MYKVCLRRYLVLVYRKRLISIVIQIFKLFFWSVNCILWVEFLHCNTYVTQVRKLKQQLSFRPLSVDVFRMFNFPQLASFFSFFFWSVNCTNLACKFYILLHYMDMPKDMESLYIWGCLVVLCTEGYCQPFTVFENAFFFWCVNSANWGTYFVQVQFLYFKRLVMTFIKNSSIAMKRMILLLFSDLEMMQIWSVIYTCQVCKLNIFFGHVQYYRTVPSTMWPIFSEFLLFCRLILQIKEEFEKRGKYWPYCARFSQRIQILKTEYKYGQYCTPLSHSKKWKISSRKTVIT